MTQIIAVLGMFASILAILRWFKQDTAEMIKIYAESTQKILASTDKRIEAIEKNVEAIKTEMKDFHDRLCEIERNRK
jgi:hypothetical protein